MSDSLEAPVIVIVLFLIVQETTCRLSMSEVAREYRQQAD